MAASELIRRWKRNGDPLIVGRGGWNVLPISEKFSERVVPGGADECWPWRGTVNTYGYGVISFTENGVRRQRIATRVAYELHRGEIPDGMLICHTCDNPICVNPNHLYAGTYQDNADDRWSNTPTPRANPELVTRR